MISERRCLLRFAASRDLNEALTAAALVLGPLLFLADTLMDPAWAEDDAGYLEEVAGHKVRYVTAEIASTIGALLLIAGMTGVMRLMHAARARSGQLAAAVVIVGLMGLVGSVAFSVLDLAMADFRDRAAMVELRGDLEDSTAYNAYWLAFFVGGVVLGMVWLAITIWRRRIVDAWSPALIIVAVLLSFLAGGDRRSSALSSLLLAAALSPLAARVWSLGDDAGARWDRLRPRADQPRTE
jgi:hypothetical protein